MAKPRTRTKPKTKPRPADPESTTIMMDELPMTDEEIAELLLKRVRESEANYERAKASLLEKMATNPASALKWFGGAALVAQGELEALCGAKVILETVDNRSLRDRCENLLGVAQWQIESVAEHRTYLTSRSDPMADAANLATIGGTTSGWLFVRDVAKMMLGAISARDRVADSGDTEGLPKP